MAAPGGGQQPPGYGRYRSPYEQPSQQPSPYAHDFMFRNFGNLEPHHQETAFVAAYGRTAFEAFLSHGTIPAAAAGNHFRTSSFTNVGNPSLQPIDVRSLPPVSDAALFGNRRDREAYWAAQLRYNMENWRRGNLGVIQIDRDRRQWGVSLRCEESWEVLRSNPNPPCISMIWDNDLGEFALYCSQSGNGHFILRDDTA